MDWITLTRHEVENDSLAPHCVHCGAPATGRENQDFEWHPEWVGWLTLAGIVPGLIAAAICGRKMRVSLPICTKHGPSSGRVIAFASVGWLLLPALLAGGAFGIAVLVNQLLPEAPLNNAALITIPSVAAGLGLIAYFAWLIRIHQGYRTIQVRSIDETGITLVGLAEPFVRAMRAQRQETVSPSPSPTNTGIVTLPES